ncbi:MAG: DNA repair exonuclease [Bryobacteraceae bacterium]
MPRLLHTADWQIGKQYKGLGGDPDCRSDLRNERLNAVRRLGELAVKHEADAVLVAGDVFDMNEVSDRLVRQTLNTLAEFRVPWVLLPGNHDAALAESVWTRIERLGCPANVRLAITREAILLAEDRLAVLPAPLLRRHESADPTEGFASTVTPPGVIRVGLAHGSVRNRLPVEAESHNLISDTAAATAQLDYLALGDWHGTFQVTPNTWYSGTPEPDGFQQQHSGQALLVEIDAAGSTPRIQKLQTGTYRWRRLKVDFRSVESELAAQGEPFGNLVIGMRVEGAISLRERAELDEVIHRWEARVKLLRANLAPLTSVPTDADFDELGRQGFVGNIVERLRAIQRDAQHPDHALAGAALQRLYAEHVLGR